MTHIRIVNTSKLVSARSVRKAAAAINVQVARDFAPNWGHGATVSTRAVSAADWVVTLADTIDVKGALGYHSDNLRP